MMRLERPPRKEICRKPLQRRRLGSHNLLLQGLLGASLRAPWRRRHKSLFHNNLCPSPALEAAAQKGRRFPLIPRAERPITGLET